MSKQFSQKNKDQCLALFLSGMPIIRISEFMDIPASTIQSWKDAGDWEALRLSVVAKTQSLLEKDTAEFISNDTKRQLEAYRKLQEKGLLELDLKESRTAGEAGDLLDKGIKGEREVAKGLVTFKLISEIARIIGEEVTDEETKRRIAAKLKGLLVGV